jgi:hypothetical protein
MKPFYQSQTLWGIAILCLPSFLRVIDSFMGTKLDNPSVDTFCTTVGGLLGVNARLKTKDLKLK